MADWTASDKVKKVAFFGYADTPPDDPLYDDVYQAARYLVKEGFTIVNGGGPGLMAAATKGAEYENGETITVTFDPQDAPGFEGKYADNIPDQEIKTSNYIERMFTLMSISDFYVIYNGGTGTLSEFATAWVLAKLYKGNHKGFVLYGAFWRPIVQVLQENMLIRAQSTEVFEIVETKEELLQAIRRYESAVTPVDKHVSEKHEELLV